MDRVRGRVVVITGGARGIGLAAVRKFLAEGAEVALWDLDPSEAAEQLRAEQPSWPILPAPVDVTSPAAVAEATAALVARTGRIDVLINNAGRTLGHVPTVQLSSSAWQTILDTNLTGALTCVQAIVPHMIARRWGRIVNVTSVLAEYGYPGHAPYVASKSALAGLTRSWAREFGRHGITVNAVRPGYIHTPMNDGNPPDVVRQVVAMTPLGRLGLPEDVANAFLWFCSEEASFVTGAILAVDGGLIT
jgi:3-oxoacyl-[acyl-carrier protein] reductase